MVMKTPLVDNSWDNRGEQTDVPKPKKERSSSVQPKSEKPELPFSSDEKIFEEIKNNFFSNVDLKALASARPDWNEYFMILAKIAASRSTCLSRTNGTVIVKDKQVLATGYNGSMAGVAHCSEEGSCYRRRVGQGDSGKMEICRAIHAEANAIAQAAKKGVSIVGADLYATLCPCYSCTKLIASAGIKKIYYEYEYKSPDGKRDQLWEQALLDAGIEVEKVEIRPQSALKAAMNILMVVAWRRELEPTGEPTGKIENINMEAMY